MGGDPAGYAPGMAQDRRNDAHGDPLQEVAEPDLAEQVATRAEPLPEEVAAGDVGDRREEAAEILRDSEERVAEAAEGNAPGDAAAEILGESEQRVAEAVAGDAPGDAAEENRRSDEGV